QHGIDITRIARCEAYHGWCGTRPAGGVLSCQSACQTFAVDDVWFSLLSITDERHAVAAIPGVIEWGTVRENVHVGVFCVHAILTDLLDTSVRQDRKGFFDVF